MIRITFLELALVATPFLLFFLYRALMAGIREKAGAQNTSVNETPYQILFLSGAAFALAALFIVVVLGDRDDVDPRDMIYIPPMVVDGEVQRGYFLPRDEAIERGLIEPSERDEDLDPDTPNPSPDAAPSP